MNRWLHLVVLASLLALVAGCGTPGAETGPTQPASQVTPAVIAEQPTPTNTLLPTAKAPTPTNPVVATTEEPAATNTLPPTATATPPSPTPNPTATLVPTVTPAAALTEQDVRRITPAEARALLDGGEAMLYDVRSAAEYNTRHAAGALSFPDAEAAARYGELPADKSLVFY